VAVEPALTCRGILFSPIVSQGVLVSRPGIVRFTGIARGLGKGMFCRYFEEEADRQDAPAGLIAVGDPSWQVRAIGPLDGPSLVEDKAIGSDCAEKGDIAYSK
jgi:hypothetical protein